MKIYALIDPRTNKIFYVGKTKDMYRRMRWHMSDARVNSNEPLGSEMAIYLHRLVKSGLYPVIEILEEVDELVVNRIEWEWALTLKLLGHPITNRLTHMVKGTAEYTKQQLMNVAA